MVCRGYKEISQDVTLLPAGDTRVAQCANTTEQRVAARDEARTAVQFNEVNDQCKANQVDDGKQGCGFPTDPEHS